MSYAQVTVIGRLGSDPRTNNVGGKDVANFSVAVDCGSKDKPETLWVDCAAWDRQAGVVTRFLRKGSFVVVVGSMKPRAYKDKNGAEVKSFSVTVQRLELGPKEDSAAKPFVTRAEEASVGGDDSDVPF